MYYKDNQRKKLCGKIFKNPILREWKHVNIKRGIIDKERWIINKRIIYWYKLI